MWYVIDTRDGLVHHEADSEESCKQYVFTCVQMWHRDRNEYKIVQGAKARDEVRRRYKKW